MQPPPFVLDVQLLRDSVPTFERYPFNLPAVRGLERLALHPHVTFLVGENGSGKSTLLEAIAIAWGFNPEGGSKNFRFATRTSHSQLHHFLRLGRSYRRARDGFFLRAETFYNLATNIESLDLETSSSPPIISSYGGHALHQQSHGESFFALFMERFGENGFYLLDEPEAALSPTRQLALVRRIHDLVNDGCQFIIATHSPIIMSYPSSTIVQLSEAGLSAVDYQDTEQYQVTREFILHHERMLRELLNDE